jgi:hypothetical protein
MTHSHFHQAPLMKKFWKSLASVFHLTMLRGKFTVRLAPDHASLIARGRIRDSTSEAFYRVPIGGGVARLIFAPDGDVCDDFRCVSQGAASRAYQVQSPDHRELIVKSFDPLTGRVGELLRIPVDPESDYHWALSPNGLLIGLLKSEWGSEQIRFFSVQSGENRAITVNGYAELRFAGLGSGFQERFRWQLGTRRLRSITHRLERQDTTHLAPAPTSEYMGHCLSRRPSFGRLWHECGCERVGDRRLLISVAHASAAKLSTTSHDVDTRPAARIRDRSPQYLVGDGRHIAFPEK